ncbi:MAG: FRG domain-containing protein [Bacteroidales bacterium]|nr:FRG domain-containing protein [Bacteroidales bacterium]
MNLETYKTIDEIKEIYEDVKIIEQKDAFDAQMKLLEEKEFYYRGVRNGTFKMYASSQRLYLSDFQRECYRYEDFLQDIITYCGKIHNNFLNGKYKLSGYSLIYMENECPLPLEYNNLWKFIILQHLFVVSPLIDFSSNIDVALFMAINNEKKVNNWIITHNNLALEDYIQIIYLENKNLNSMTCKLYNDLERSHINQSDSKSLYEQYQQSTDIINQYFETPTYIPYGGELREYGTVCGKKVFRYNLSNPNIEKQSGLLFINNNNDNLPFEHYWQESKQKIYNDLPPLKMLLIHKSLIPDIEKYLKEKTNVEDLKEHFLPIDMPSLQEELFNTIKQKRNFK